MSFQAIENDIKSGAVNEPKPILLCGEESFLTDHYEKQLKALFSGSRDGVEGGAAAGLDTSVFDMKETDDEAVMADLDTYPMLSPLRVVIVRRHPGLSGKKAEIKETAESNDSGKKKDLLAEYIAAIPKESRLIFVSNDVSKTRVLYKAIAKHGTIYDFSRLDEDELRRFALKRFKAQETTIAFDVLDAFVFATGYLEKNADRDLFNLFTVEKEAFKLASFVRAEGRNAITHADLEECMPGILRTDVFAMLDAISAGRKAEAIRLLENSLAGGENLFRLLNLFTGHFEIMLGYKELSAAGHPPSKITQILGERSDWRVKKLGDFAKRFDTKKLQWIVGRLYDTERDIKSGDISERMALTVLLAEI